MNRYWLSYPSSASVETVQLLKLVILSRLSRLHPPAVGTNWPLCVDVPLNANQTNKTNSYWSWRGKKRTHHAPLIVCKSCWPESRCRGSVVNTSTCSGASKPPFFSFLSVVRQSLSVSVAVHAFAPVIRFWESSMWRSTLNFSCSADSHLV